MDEKNSGWDTALKVLPQRLRVGLERNAAELSPIVYEINLRADCPLVLITAKGRRYLTENGFLTTAVSSDKLLMVTREEIKDIFLRLCSYSVYSFQNEINLGFVTFGGGCRAGICGTAVITDEKISSVKSITSVNLRIARECIGCADELLQRVDPLKGVLLCGAPSSGKTTLLRDMVRALSYRYKVSLIDERNELSATVEGKAHNDVGLCDVYVRYPKYEAILQSIRSMSPDIIACDELGDRKEADALRYALYCGASFVATVHSSTPDRGIVRELISTGAFSYLVMLADREHAGQIKEIQCLS